MLNWIVWNRTVFVYQTELFAIELFFDIETVLMLNWIIWNRTVYMYKNGFSINNLQCVIKPN